MNAHLLFQDKTIEQVRVDERTVHDLELSCIIDHMADADSFIRDNMYYVFSTKNVCPTPAEITYRQDILSDSLKYPEELRKLYAHVGKMVRMDRDTYLSTSHKKAKYMLDVAVKVMLSMKAPLTDLYHMAGRLEGFCVSDGLTSLCRNLIYLFDPKKLDVMEEFMKDLSPKEGITSTAVLYKHLRAGEYHPTRNEEVSSKGFLRFLKKDKNTIEFDVDMDDPESSPALSKLRDLMCTPAATIVVASRNELFDFLKELHQELSFYIGCLNLKKYMDATGLPVSFPDVDSGFLEVAGLHNLSLALMQKEAGVGNTLSVSEEKMIVITGSNQGGKTTFLRSLGQALLMAASGMFAAATSFKTCPGRVFTHFIREEDKSLKSGKLDEELLRMREITDHIRSGDWLLLNESFASTNEEEGSEIAMEIITAMFDQGVRIAYVTHFYHLVRLLKNNRADQVIFFNASRDATGSRTYRIVSGEPKVRGYGEDLYHEIFKET